MSYKIESDRELVIWNVLNAVAYSLVGCLVFYITGNLLAVVLSGILTNVTIRFTARSKWRYNYNTVMDGVYDANRSIQISTLVAVSSLIMVAGIVSAMWFTIYRMVGFGVSEYLAIATAAGIFSLVDYWIERYTNDSYLCINSINEQYNSIQC